MRCEGWDILGRGIRSNWTTCYASFYFSVPCYRIHETIILPTTAPNDIADKLQLDLFYHYLQVESFYNCFINGPDPLTLPIRRPKIGTSQGLRMNLSCMLVFLLQHYKLNPCYIVQRIRAARTNWSHIYIHPPEWSPSGPLAFQAKSFYRYRMSSTANLPFFVVLISPIWANVSTTEWEYNPLREILLWRGRMIVGTTHF